MKYGDLIEESVKIDVARDFFGGYRYTQLGRIDFVIAERDTENGQLPLLDEETVPRSILWAEAKQGIKHDIYESFVQLILTIGKEKTFEKYLPPRFLGAFDAEKIAFIEYHEIQAIFYQNDFNWNVAPSNHESKEFKQLFSLTKSLLEEKSLLFFYETQSAELKEFIRRNFVLGKDVSEKIAVTKNNFTFVFQKWSDAVKPTIAVDWEKVNKKGIISADFFLADLLSENNESIKENLFVVLQKTRYELARKIDEETGLFDSKRVGFTDGQKAHRAFWAIYERPPKEEYWDYIIARRDLLVPQDIRERKGSFFTPQIWVEKSQQYLASVLGEKWQDEYYIWDCCAGTGNLLNGLTNWRNVWASTLDKQDVDVMRDRIENGWSMFENHVFQFDFLNDEFTKCPEDLREILTDEQKRKKLVIYINPPYAEASNARTSSGTGENRKGLSDTKTREKYLSEIGKSINELFAQFLIRMYKEINGCTIANFSTLKILCAPNFEKFRNVFQAKLEKLFIVPAWTFDNVKGEFPIGFFVWNTACIEQKHAVIEPVEMTNTVNTVVSTRSTTDSTETALAVSNPCGNGFIADVFDTKGLFLQTKDFKPVSDKNIINKWLHSYFDNSGEKIAWLRFVPNDFQNNSGVYITNSPNASDIRESRITGITKKNLLIIAIYFAVRKVIEHTWINHNDQFLFPNDGWQTDFEFQGDCLTYTLFGDKNRISANPTSNSSLLTPNYFIPFTERQVGCKKAFKSTFMSDFLRDFLAGKVDVSATPQHDDGDDLFGGVAGVSPAEGVAENAKRLERGGDFPHSDSSLVALSFEAGSVYNAALELWKYYHAQPCANPDASFYDIRRHFQGETNGRMNNDSDDARYTELIGDLRQKQKALAKKIAAGVYRHGFLK